MIDLKALRYYPPPLVMDEDLDNTITRLIEAAQQLESEKKRIQKAVMLLKAFLDASGRHLTYADIKQSTFLTAILREFYGFVFSEIDSSHRNKYFLLSSFSKILTWVCNEINLSTPEFPRINRSSANNCVLDCISAYLNHPMNTEKMKYYAGWIVTDKKGGAIRPKLARFYTQYGAALTSQIQQAIQSFLSKHGTISAQTYSDQFNKLISTICDLCSTANEFKQAGYQTHINSFVMTLFAAQKIEVKCKGYSMKSFYEKWQKNIIFIESILIEGGLWEEPMYELFCPRYKSSSRQAHTHVDHDKQGNAFNYKLITHIPLSYSDEQAIEALLDSIQNDIVHVSAACKRVAERTMVGVTRRKLLATQGKVRPLERYLLKVNPKWVDMTDIANQCATWEHYGLYYPDLLDYRRFLCVGNSDFATNFGLLTSTVLFPFLYLLVEQHPVITPSWLINFELFDKNGKQAGFKQAGGSWIAVSHKYRKGPKKSLQSIILNTQSKKLFDNIIEITSQAREYLKSQSSDDWRWLLLTNKSPFGKPTRRKKFRGLKCDWMRSSPLGQEIRIPSEFIDESGANSLVNNLNLGAMRASCGVRIYLQTRSVKIMSEALGHDFYKPKLLSHYLPDPILNYFQSRWVRIFQNALVYESLQDSNYLLAAVDFGEDELEAFLRNHKLKPLPEHLVTGQVNDLDLPSSLSEPTPMRAILPVSPPVLSVMNTLVALVESAKPNQSITRTAAGWYDTAKFVTQFIKLNTNKANAACSDDVIRAMAHAKKNPTPFEKLVGAVYAD